jgi:hypothetical protein
LQLQQANVEELSGVASEQLSVDDRGEEQEGDDDDDDGDNQADEKKLTKIVIPNFNKAVTMTVELTYFIIDIVPLKEGRIWLCRGTEGPPKENVSTNCYFLILSETPKERFMLLIYICIFLVNDQLDAQFFFSMCLFQFSTCFEQPCAHHQENQLYQYNIWYVSF